MESTNKVLEEIMTKTVWIHRKYWEENIPKDLWAYNTTHNSTTDFTPYELVYGKQVLLPIEFQVKNFGMATELGMDLIEAQKKRVEKLNELDETRQDSLQHNILI